MFLISCRKFITVGSPDNLVTQENVYLDDATATSVLNDLYASQNSFAVNIAKYTGLSGDDFILWENGEASLAAYYTNDLMANFSTQSGMEIWNLCFQNIFICNSAIQGLLKSEKITSSVKQQLLGEAYFMRGFFFHYLLNLYGPVPLIVDTDPEINRKKSRSPTDLVHAFIIEDLLKAAQLLSSDYLNTSLKPYVDNPERVRPTKWAAKALLAREYCYNHEYAKAEQFATEIIENIEMFDLVELNKVFKKNEREAIFQLQPVIIGWNTLDAQFFNLRAEPSGLSPDKPMRLSPSLVNVFESNDKRSTIGVWLDSLIYPNYSSGLNDTLWFPVKYNVANINMDITSPTSMTEYCMVLRLSEQYLIRAEARASLNKLASARNDLNTIRNRAGLNDCLEADQDSLLMWIFKERRVELFSEWAHRWIDMRRSGYLDDLMIAAEKVKGGNWSSYDKLYPIPFQEIQYNPQLSQNPGY